jgi:hypothetical protein
VKLDKKDDVLYTSPTIPVGSELKGLKLDKELSAGNYDAVVVYHLVDENDKEVSSVAFTIVIHVLE